MIDALITALNQELALSAKEIADLFWLAMQVTNELDSPRPNLKKGNTDLETLNKKDLARLDNGQNRDSSDSKGKSRKKKDENEPKAGLYPRRSSDFLDSSGLRFKVPDAPALREPLKLAGALKPLMRRLPTGTDLVLDEEATIERIAAEGIWLPVLRPTLEPWLDLELVVEEGISMQIWRQAIADLERLLKNYGIFRDVRVWGLLTDDHEQVRIRRGIGSQAKGQSLRSPAELVDPTGRRLILVVSDCVSLLWRNGKLTAVLELWTKQGSMAIVQMLPKWLWKRTALGRASEVLLQGLLPGDFNQQLMVRQVSLWEDLEEVRGAKVPVFSLEVERVAIWAQMLSGRSVWATGYLFKLEDIAVSQAESLFNLNSGDLTAEDRVQGFRVTASPVARKLAGLLAAAPMISLPIVRLIQETLLRESQQVHVAEVFLGGLLKPLSVVDLEVNPNDVLYEFMDGVRDLLFDSVPSGYVLNVVDEVSKYVAKRVGLSLQDFAAVLRNPQAIAAQENASNFHYFATVTAQILRSLGGEYEKIADSLKSEEINVKIDNIKTEVEQNRHLLWQEGKTKIYSLLTDEPWTLPFDALVVSCGYRVGFGGRMAESLKQFLGEEKFGLLRTLINQTQDENQQSLISPEAPLMVSLSSEIKPQFPKVNPSSDCFLICATVEDPEPSVAGAFKATEGIILKIAEQQIKYLVLPLLGTGLNSLPIHETAIAILSAISKSLKKISPNSIEEIIIVNLKESSIEIINQAAHTLFAQEYTDKIELFSEVGIDYSQLRNLLAEENWKEADIETAQLILQASGQQKRGWLDEENMKAFPSTDLQTIDRLWSKYSNERFGLGVQKQIWLNVGGQIGYDDDEIYKKFGETVGWYKTDEDQWLLWDEHTFTLDAPKGHLPRHLPSQGQRIRHYLFYRQDLKYQMKNFASQKTKIIESDKDNEKSEIDNQEFFIPRIERLKKIRKGSKPSGLRSDIRIIGERGAGKTTFLAALACLSNTNSGKFSKSAGR
jgi:hypothetical protein